MGNSKIKVFIDVDDTLLQSSEAVIDVLNQKYNTGKTVQDVRDWGFKSIKSDLTSEEVGEIFGSSMFWDCVKPIANCLETLQKFSDHLDITIVTVGSAENLKYKAEWLEEFLPQATLLGIPCTEEHSNGKFSKDVTDMKGGIQIDDRMDALHTNASLKILIKNGRNWKWGNPDINMDNLYIVNYWDEIQQILSFFIEHPDMVETNI